MRTSLDLFVLGLSERIGRLWGNYLNLSVLFKPCPPVERYGVEVMVGLPATTSFELLGLGTDRGLVVMDMALLLGAIDRQLGGEGHPPEERARAPTLVEEALCRKLVQKLLPGIQELWTGFLANFPEIVWMDSGGHLISPWEPQDLVVETCFSGGWPGCQGSLRFFWPRRRMEEVFSNLDIEHIEVDQWSRVEDIVEEKQQGKKEEADSQEFSKPSKDKQQISRKSSNPSPAKKRIAFDDFDAMIAALNEQI
jgi:hypothetical protein